MGLFARAQIAAHTVLDVLLPPRGTDATIRALSAEDLFRLRGSYAQDAFEYLIPYRDPRAQALVWEVKYRANPRALMLAGALIADVLLSIVSEELGMPLLLPMPMHRNRLRMRGFNQAALLCESALKRAPKMVHYAPQTLIKIRQTPTQQGLSREERLKNVENSMAAHEEIVRGRTCIVLDDVVTTGATFAEARRALEEAGASEVYCLALAG